MFVNVTAAFAQNASHWQFKKSRDFREEGFVEAGICRTDPAPPRGRASHHHPFRYCVYLICQSGQPKTARWKIKIPSYIYAAANPDVTWTVDGRPMTFTMEMQGPNENGVHPYEAYFDPDSPDASYMDASRPGPTLAQSQALLQSLKSGNRLTIKDRDFSSPQISLSGSNAALSQVQAACPWIMAKDVATTTMPSRHEVLDDDDPVEAANRAWNAVLTMAARQNCSVTESEFHDAYVDVGGGDSWTAGLILEGGLKDGSIIHLGETKGEHSYRLTDCTPR